MAQKEISTSPLSWPPLNWINRCSPLPLLWNILTDALASWLLVPAGHSQCFCALLLTPLDVLTKNERCLFSNLFMPVALVITKLNITKSMNYKYKEKVFMKIKLNALQRSNKSKLLKKNTMELGEWHKYKRFFTPVVTDFGLKLLHKSL